jgi:hypothetical protein
MKKATKLFTITYTRPMWDEQIVRAATEAEARKKLQEIIPDARVTTVQKWEDADDL